MNNRQKRGVTLQFEYSSSVDFFCSYVEYRDTVDIVYSQEDDDGGVVIIAGDLETFFRRFRRFAMDGSHIGVTEPTVRDCLNVVEAALEDIGVRVDV